jgi:retinol dehydrogenase 12
VAEAERIALVTGASAGIGLYTALGLAGAGFRVIMTGRDPGRTDRARRIVAERAPAGAAETALADFASLAAVRQLAETVLSRHGRLDVLVNNVGLISPSYRVSEDGFELTVAVNHLAPFLLTNLLLDRLRASAPSRIVTVASQAHRGARVDPIDMVGRQNWSPLKAYGRSKLCNILFTRALARRLEGSGVMTGCLHPGVVATGIGNNAGRFTSLGWRVVKPFLISAEQGAATSLFLATTADPVAFHGAYVIGKRIARPDPTALDNALAERLWDESARLVGLSAA